MNRFRYILLILVSAVVTDVCGQEIAHIPFKHYGDMVERFAKARPIDSTDVVMLGNSLTEYAGNWSKLMHADKIVNRGIAGDDATGMYNRLGQILPGRPKAIFLMAGINDLSHNHTPARVAELVERVMARIRRESPSTRLYVQSLLPISESGGRWKLLEGKTDDVAATNVMLAGYCRKHNVEYIDLFPRFVRRGTNTMRSELTSDGLHLTPLGYKQWSFVLRKYIRALYD